MIDWRGEEVVDKTLLAMATGINTVMAGCVQLAKQKVRRRTTTLQGSIQMREARAMPQGVVGVWGSFNVNYALAVELGTKPHFPPVDAIKRGMQVPEGVAWAIAIAISRRGTRAYPYLRPTADALYPTLIPTIKGLMK